MKLRRRIMLLEDYWFGIKIMVHLKIKIIGLELKLLSWTDIVLKWCTLENGRYGHAPI